MEALCLLLLNFKVLISWSFKKAFPEKQNWQEAVRFAYVSKGQRMNLQLRDISCKCSKKQEVRGLQSGRNLSKV